MVRIVGLTRHPIRIFCNEANTNEDVLQVVVTQVNVCECSSRAFLRLLEKLE